MKVDYRDSLDGITPDMLEGFFRGWKAPNTPGAHLQIMRNSNYAVLAVDPARRKVVGFVTALTDGIQAAYIPLLEVLPDYQRRGIGTELMKRILKKLEGTPAIDLTCDPQLQKFYSRFGMQPSVGMVIRDYWGHNEGMQVTLSAAPDGRRWSKR
jgi:ribosomal protein S18 acetylase RimI-like enzyme